MTVPFSNTDSLYKYIAILGIALALSPSLYLKETLQLHLEVIDFSRQIAQQDRRIKALLAEQATLAIKIQEINSSSTRSNDIVDQGDKLMRSIYERVLEMSKNPPPDAIQQIIGMQQEITAHSEKLKLEGSKSSSRSRELDELSKELDSIQASNANINEILIDKDYELRKLEVKKEELDRRFVLVFLSVSLGGGMTLSGFMAWYLKVQRFMDAELSKRAIITPVKRGRARRLRGK